MFAIIGSGFGLYGYMPALVDDCAQRVVLPERYRARLAERRELARYAGHIRWERDEAAALDSAEGAVLALRPMDQSEWLPRCLARANLERLILEKPLAHSPEAAARTLDSLARSNKTFRIGYIFRYTDWAAKFFGVMRAAQGGGRVSIRWNFLAHHFRFDLHNWKRSDSAGGGAIRFYGIQFIALLAEAGYREVLRSRSSGASADETDRWHAAFSGPGLPECTLAVDSRSGTTDFLVEREADGDGGGGEVLASLDDPFAFGGSVAAKDELDRRVPYLGRVCRSLRDGNAGELELYAETIGLWRKVEDNTRFVKLHP